MELPRRLAVIAILSVTVVAAGTAVAPPTASAQPVDAKRRAEAPLKEGLELAKAGKVEPALARFEESYALAPTGTAAFHIARMEQALARHALALQHYREALRDPGLATEPRRDAERAVEDLKTKVGVITLDVPPGSATTVDGNDVDPRTPIEVVPGLHVVKSRLGGESKSLDITAPAGSVTPVKIRFGDDGAARPAAASEPATAPPAATRGESPPRWPTAKLVTVGAGAVLGVGLLAASGILFASASGFDKPDDPAGCAGGSATSSECARLADERASYDGQRTASTILFYSGLGVGALTVAAVLLWPNDRLAVGGLSVGSRRGSAGGLTFRF